MSRTEVTLRVGLLELMLLALGEVELLADSSIEPLISTLWLTSFDRSSVLPDSFKPLAQELGAVVEPVVPAVDVVVLALADGCAFIRTYWPPAVSAVEGEVDGLGVVPVVPAGLLALPDWRHPVTVTALPPLIRSL
jgi:hypothetical protein